MDEEHPLIKIDVFGGLSKPATLLIQKISDAIGGFAPPWQRRRLAHAEADAKIIETTAQIESTGWRRGRYTGSSTRR